MREQLQRLQKEMPRQPRGKENPAVAGAPLRGSPTDMLCAGLDAETLAQLKAKMQVQDAEKIVLQQELALALRALNLTSPQEQSQEDKPSRGAAGVDGSTTLTQLLELVGETKRLKRLADGAQQSNKDHERIIWALRQELALHSCDNVVHAS